MTLLGNFAHIIEDSDGTTYLIFRKDLLAWLDSQARVSVKPGITILGEPLRKYWGINPDDFGLVGIDDYRVTVIRTQINQTHSEFISNLIALIEHTIELFYDYDVFCDWFDSPAPTGDVKILA